MCCAWNRKPQRETRHRYRARQKKSDPAEANSKPGR
jgi:hypothetical protein